MPRVAVARSSASPAPVTQDTTNRKNMLLLIHLRWIAVAGQIVTMAVVQLALGILLPLGSMALVLGGLVLLNVVSYLWLRGRTEVSNRALLVALVLDVIALTLQLYLSGGISNPFTALYLLQLALAALLLDVASAWTIVGVTALALLWLTQFNLPLVRARDGAFDLPALNTFGMLVCLLLDAVLLVIFLVRITNNLRRHDARLAALKQQAAEEDLIVRMGLLASGAAHELGTPLASIAVILGDWRRMPEVCQNLELVADIDEMQAAIQRCKAIVTDVLQSAGEARGEAPSLTTVNTFLANIVQAWQAAVPSAKLDYRNNLAEDVPIVADSTLKQILFNLLDNAYEASPHWIQFIVAQEGGALSLEVRDAGAGFPPEVLKHLGTPYQSTKGRGGGLGLFLVVNVVRKLGGSVTARNLADRGAAVSLRLPLQTLTARSSGRAG